MTSRGAAAEKLMANILRIAFRDHPSIPVSAMAQLPGRARERVPGPPLKLPDQHCRIDGNRSTEQDNRAAWNLTWVNSPSKRPGGGLVAGGFRPFTKLAVSVGMSVSPYSGWNTYHTVCARSGSQANQGPPACKLSTGDAQVLSKQNQPQPESAVRISPRLQRHVRPEVSRRVGAAFQAGRRKP